VTSAEDRRRGRRSAAEAPGTAADRIAAATALRELGHLLVGREVSAAMLEQVVEGASAWADEIDRTAPRRRPDDGMARDLAARPDDGDEIEHFADCPISGAANPFSFDMEARRDGDEAVIDVTLGAGHEGAPGRAHGGIVAAFFDDAFGFLVGITGLPTYAGELTIRFVRPTPVTEPMVARCWMGAREGRRQHVHGELRHQGVVVVEARSILVVVPEDQLGRATYAYADGAATS
jgi:acyl-coenzyme A thioesterase PaaI-like protein